MNKLYDMVLQSSSIYDSVSKEAFSGYITVKDGNICNVERGMVSEEVLKSTNEFISCGNKTICAGFGDTHTFFTGYVIEHLGVDLSECISIEQLRQKIENISLDKEVIFGNHLSYEFIDNEAVNIMLDEISAEKPIVLFNEGHNACALNSIAKRKYAIASDRCYAEALYKIMKIYLNDREFIEKEFEDYMHLLNSRGITSVKEMGFDDFYGFTTVLKDMEDEKRMTLRLSFMSQPVGEPMNLEYAKKMKKLFRGEFVRFSGFNQMTDGLILKQEGHLLQPYEGTKTTCKKEIPYEEIEKDVLEADKAGIRYTLHSEGDGAFREILKIYEKCEKVDGKIKNRHGITDLELTNIEDEKKMAEMGVFGEIYTQVYSLDTYDGYVESYKKVIGERQKRYLNYRSLVEQGVRLCGATDLPLLIPDIPESIYYGCANYGKDHNKRINPENGLSMCEMLDVWTKNSQFAMERENELGTIEVGKKADLVIFDANLFDTPIDKMLSVKVWKTFINGRPVYEKE